jgi:hypothetical protein
MNMWYTYSIVFYSIIKKNEIISFVGKWMEMDIIIFFKISQTEKDRYLAVTCIPCSLSNGDSRAYKK